MNRATAWTLATAVVAGMWMGVVPFAHAQASPQGCDQDGQHSQQDFALGDWDVFADGRQTARVRLEKVLKGCAIRETWTPVDKGEEHGIGMFTYSRLLGHWGYFWVADNGQTTQFSGDSQGAGDMLYLTMAPRKDGSRWQRHWTLKLQPDGSIQELSVGSADGQNWSKEYELIWRKRKGGPSE